MESPRGAVAALASIGLLVLAALVIAPLPASAVGTVAGGILAMSLSRGRFVVLVSSGALFGAMIGASFHAYVHWIEGSLQPQGELLGHVLRQAISGACVGLAALIPAFIAVGRR